MASPQISCCWNTVWEINFLKTAMGILLSMFRHKNRLIYLQIKFSSFNIVKKKSPPPEKRAQQKKCIAKWSLKQILHGSFASWCWNAAWEQNFAMKSAMGDQIALLEEEFVKHLSVDIWLPLSSILMIWSHSLFGQSPFVHF